MTGKIRLDLLLVQRGLLPDQDEAQRYIMAGQVRVNGQAALHPATPAALDDEVVVASGPRFVSRGGEKLEAALQAFPLPAAGRVCADVGASTGGFTDCLLQRGAQRVYAIDVGHGILDWKLRQDPRVVVMEGVNARYLERLPEAVSLVSIDASFISLKTLLPVVKGWLAEQGGDVLALVKPQFEAARAQAARARGVIRDAAVHRQVLLGVLTAAQQESFAVRGVIRSPLLGPKGNAEFLLHLAWPGEAQPDLAAWLSDLSLV